MRFIAIVIALAALGACREDAPPVAAALPQAPGAWAEFTPRAVEIDGETVTPACAGFPGADPAFRFWARRGSVDKLVIYFDGGGACWDDATCSQPRLASGAVGQGYYKAELLPTDDPAHMRGVFELDNAANPLRDWSMVFVPYCTGDVHSGAADHTYRDPQTGHEYTLHHRGSDNFRVVLEWIRENFDAPQEILVTGSSAGAYGAVTQFARVREAYPTGRAIMLGDAGQGVTTPGFTRTRENTWGNGLPRDVFGDAPLRTDQDAIAILAARYPNDRFAQYTTAHDRTQTAFFSLLAPRNSCALWTEGMWRDLERREGIGNFRAYLAAGDTHTILRSPLFYTEQSGGAPFSQWLGTLVGGDGAQNQACTNCLTPPPECPFDR